MDNKLVLVGDSGTGKTTWLNRIVTGGFKARHDRTLGVEIRHIMPSMNNGPLWITVWDTAGDPRCLGIRDGYWIGAQAFVVFYDVTRRETFDGAKAHICEIQKMNPSASILLVGNKVDNPNRQVRAAEATQYENDSGIKTIDLSAKSNHNFSQPITWATSVFQQQGLDDEGVDE